MRIRMLATAAGPAGVWQAGGVYDAPEDQAQALIAGGYAVAIGSSTAPPVGTDTETATESLGAVETAVEPVAPRKRGRR